jgi:hypothetical protein
MPLATRVGEAELRFPSNLLQLSLEKLRTLFQEDIEKDPPRYGSTFSGHEDTLRLSHTHPHGKFQLQIRG